MLVIHPAMHHPFFFQYVSANDQPAFLLVMSVSSFHSPYILSVPPKETHKTVFLNNVHFNRSCVVWGGGAATYTIRRPGLCYHREETPCGLTVARLNNADTCGSILLSFLLQHRSSTKQEGPRHQKRSLHAKKTTLKLLLGPSRKADGGRISRASRR